MNTNDRSQFNQLLLVDFRKVGVQGQVGYPPQNQYNTLQTGAPRKPSFHSYNQFFSDEQTRNGNYPNVTLSPQQ